MAGNPYLPQLSDSITKKGEVRARSQIRSKQLRRGLFIKRYDATHSSLIVPHFWATYIHDGRGPVRGNPLLIWFRNPKDDPRLFAGNTPERLSQTRKMTKAEFQKWSRINRQIIQAYKKRTGKRVLSTSELESLKLPMIVARYSPAPYKSSKVFPFFSNEPGGGMQGFSKEVSAEATTGVSANVRARLSAAGLLNAKVSATVRLG